MRLASLLSAISMNLVATAVLAGPIAVTNANDSGIGSLRDAIDNANANVVDFNDINFAIPGPGPWVIHLLSPLPAITSPLAIHGSAAAGYVANTAPVGQPMNGTLVIELDGTGAGVNATAITFAYASSIDGVVINNCSGKAVSIGVDGASVSRCYVGTDRTGLIARPNNIGVYLASCDNCIVSGCLISGNSKRGIELNQCGSSTISSNYVGTDKTGAAALGNGDSGVQLYGGSVLNTIGFLPAGNCTLPALGGNVIAFNAGDGVEILGGTSVNDRNRIYSNLVFSNGGLGIDLESDGVTLNDNLDADIGANQRQNFPVLVSVAGNTVYGYIRAAAGQSYVIQLFHNPACDPTTYGEGRQYLGYLTTAVTDGSGQAVFTFTCGAIPAGGFITATTTDANGNTSEFSKCLSSPPTAAGALPRAFALRNNVPNPFNPATTITYQLASRARVRIDIYDAAGAFVRTLVDEWRGAGESSVTWNGEDASGRRVASGMYFYRMRAGSFAETRKMVLLK
jgi:parallel beta-helix repeat protein